MGVVKRRSHLDTHFCKTSPFFFLNGTLRILHREWVSASLTSTCTILKSMYTCSVDRVVLHALHSRECCWL